MRKAFLALFVALVSTCALALGGSVAGASSTPPGFTQNQVGENTNKTDQQSQATATTDQLNLNLPISVLSPGANSGDVDQSNRSNTSVFSFNENRSKQGIDQVQQGQVTGWGGNGFPGLDQSQDAKNANETSQDSSAEATTKQANVNVPIAILSPGANRGDVDQSNRADTEVGSGNSNSSDQWVDQTQQGSVDNSGHEPRCDKDCGHAQCSHEKWGKDDCKPQHPQNHDYGKRCPCPDDHQPQPHLSQNQQGANTNETHQSSSAEATTKQTNVNKPISILDFGHDGKVRDDGYGKGDSGSKDWGHDKGWEHGPERPDTGHAGHVNQSNSAGTSVVSHNANDSAQGIHQVQQGSVGGLGGNHSGQPSC